MSDKRDNKKDLHRKIWLNVRNYTILFFTILSYIVIGASFFSNNASYSDGVATGLYNTFIAIVCFIAYSQLKKDGHVKEDTSLCNKKSLVCGLSGSILFCVGILFAFAFVNVYIHDPTMDIRQDVINNMSDQGLRMIASCSIIPLAEEAMMRLFLYNLLKTESNWIVSMCASSFVFSLFHATISHLIFGFMFGMMMCLLYEYFGKWWVSVIIHIIYNIMANICSDFAISVASSFFIMSILFFAAALIVLVGMFLLTLKKRKVKQI